jgi:hypothetical protein
VQQLAGEITRAGGGSGVARWESGSAEESSNDIHGEQSDSPLQETQRVSFSFVSSVFYA